MDILLPPPIASVRDVLPTLGFSPVWGTATELDPAYVFKGGGIDITVAQVTSFHFRPEFTIGGTAFTVRSIRQVEQPMPLALESREQIVAWLTFAVGVDFVPIARVEWFLEGLNLQHLLPWERLRADSCAERREIDRLRLLRPHCVVERGGLRAALNAASRAVGWPPAPGHFTITFDGEVLKLRVRGRLIAVPAEGAAWPNIYDGEVPHLHWLSRRLAADPVEVGIWHGMLEVGRVQLPVVVSPPALSECDDAASKA